MKILTIGDFHGKFPEKKVKAVIKKNNVELVISLGDFLPFTYRKLWFKHCYGKDIELWEVIGKKKYKELELSNVKRGGEILKRIDKISIPVITITGNLDRTKWKEVWKGCEGPKSKWKWAEQDFFTPIMNKCKRIKCFDFSFFKFRGYVFIGCPRGSFPGHVKSKEYKRQRKKLDKLFKKFRKENRDKRVVFITHNVPYKTKLDKITDKNAHKKAKRRYYGSKLARRIIEKYQPILAVGGHIHESWGRAKIRKTLVINPGAAIDGRMAVINLPEKKKEKLKIKFIK